MVDNSFISNSCFKIACSLQSLSALCKDVLVRQRVSKDCRRNKRELKRGDFVIELDQFKQRLASHKNSMTEVRDSL